MLHVSFRSFPRLTRCASALLPGMLATLSLAAAQEPLAIAPVIHSVNLQMQRGADQDTAQLTVELAARFADGQLLGWNDVQVVSADGPDGRMIGQATAGSTLLQRGDSEDDLSVPLTIEFSGFVRPPTAIKKLRVTATALIGHGVSHELALPDNATGRTFAPADDRKATVTAKAEKDHWRLELTAALAERCVHIHLRRADGTDVESYVSQDQAGPQRTVVDLRSNEGDIAGTKPVLMLVEKVEHRAVVLASEQLDLFGSSADPELLPLGGDPAAPKDKVVPPPGGAVEVGAPEKAKGF